LLQKKQASLNDGAEGLTAIASCDLIIIDRECEVFSRYLVNQPPTAYIHRQYEMAVLARDLANEAELAPLDRSTLGLARRNVFLTRVADAYCAIFHPHGVLRRKLILLLAVLEHSPPTAALFDRPKVRGPIGITTNLLLLGLNFALLLLLGILLLLPSHLFRRKQGKRTSEQSEK
jgi:hypothetical protein